MIGIESVIDKKNGKSSEITKLYVRYRVSFRCSEIVKVELKKLEINHSISQYGAICFIDGVSQQKLTELRRNLQKSGLDLLDVHESKLVDHFINTITDVIHRFDVLPKLTYSEIITENIFEENESFLKIFSEVVGMSVIQFIIIQKVKRIKELLLYDEMSLTEMARKLNYKNEQYLAAQFKKCTGLSPEYYKGIKKERSKIASLSSNFNKTNSPDFALYDNSDVLSRASNM